MKQLDKANSVFAEALTAEAGGKKKVLLEEAFKAYVDILVYIPPEHTTSMMLVRKAVLEKIHAVEALLEQEIERSVISNSNSNNNSSNDNNEIEKEIEKEVARLQAD